MANKETNNFKAALNELLSGKITTEENKPPLFKEEVPKPYETIEETLERAQEVLNTKGYNMGEDKALGEDEVSGEEEILNIEEKDDELVLDQIDKEVVNIQPEYRAAPQVSVASMQQVVELKVVDHETVIAHDVIIEGNIRSSSRLRIVGEVTGDVKSTADVVIEGKVGGAIQGNNIFLSECEVNNSITASNEVTISERSMINGDVKAGAVTSNGVINGNLDAQSVTLNSASRTVGDVKCKLIKIGEGAGLKGALETID